MLKMELTHMIVTLVEAMLKPGDTEHALFVPLRIIGTKEDGTLVRRFVYLLFVRQHAYTLVGVKVLLRALPRTNYELSQYTPLVYHDSGWKRDGIDSFLRELDFDLSREVAPERSPKETEIKTVFLHTPELGVIESLSHSRDDMTKPIDITWES